MNIAETKKDDVVIDADVIRRIKAALRKGNDAEVRKRKDGVVAVFEVRKQISK